MAVRIRLRRTGAKKRPHFRIVVADKRSPRDGRFLESIGIYDPVADPAKIEIDREKALKWLNDGADASDAARSLLSKVGIWQEFRTGVRPSEEEIAARSEAGAPAAAKPAAEPEPEPEPEAAAEPTPTPAEPAEREAPEPTVESEPEPEPEPEPEEATPEPEEEPEEEQPVATGADAGEADETGETEEEEK